MVEHSTLLCRIQRPRRCLRLRHKLYLRLWQGHQGRRPRVVAGSSAFWLGIMPHLWDMW